MPRISSIDLMHRIESNILSIRTRTDVEKLPDIIGAAYDKMAKYLKEQDVVMCDAPFVAYYNMDMEDLDVEIGFVVPKALPAKDDMKPGVIAEGKTAVCMYRGSYGDVEPVYMEMLSWIFAHEYEATGIVHEYYYNSPDEFPTSELLTRIVMDIK